MRKAKGDKGKRKPSFFVFVLFRLFLFFNLVFCDLTVKIFKGLHWETTGTRNYYQSDKESTKLDINRNT